MTPLSFVSYYDPSWEGQEFTEREYCALLQKLAQKKEDEILLVDEQSIKIAGSAMRIWQKIKEIFGFENQADPVKVNYQLLKLLRYGENQNYLNDATVQQWLRALQKTLVDDRHQLYQRVTHLIEQILSAHINKEPASLADRDIILFYRSNQSHLRNAYWSEIYNKYTQPTQEQAAKLLYNGASILIKEGRLSEGIDQLKRALAMSPHHNQWQLTLASTLIAFGKTQPLEKAFTSSQEALSVLNQIVTHDDEIIFQNKIKAAKKEASYLMAQEQFQVLLNQVAQYSEESAKYTAEEAFSDLKEAQSLISSRHDLIQTETFKNEWKQAVERLFQNMDYSRHPEEVMDLADELLVLYSDNPKKCALYRNIQGDIKYQLKDYTSALQLYHEAAKANSLQPQYTDNCMRCHVALAEEAFDKSNYPAMKNEYAIIWDNASPLTAKRALEQLLKKVGSLESTHLKEAIAIYRWLVPHLERTPVDNESMVRVYLRLAADNRDDLEQALAWLEKAQALEPDDRNIASFRSKIYVTSIEESLEKQDLDQASLFFKKFRTAFPEDPRLTAFEILISRKRGLFYYNQGDLKKALEEHQKTLLLAPNSLPDQKAAAICAIELGNHYYALSSFHDLRQSFRGLIKYIWEESPYKNEIRSSLGAFWGDSSKENIVLKNLGSTIKTPEKLEADFNMARNLIRSAYDGKANHKKPEDMPEELKEKLASFQQQLKVLLSFVNTLYRPEQVFLENISDKKQTDEMLSFQENEMLHFYELANTYTPRPSQEFHRRLYDLYLKRKQYPQALEINEKLKLSAFSVKNTPELYGIQIEKYLAQKELNEARQLATRAVAEFPEDKALKQQLSLIWYKFGEEQLKEKNYKLAFNCLKKSINCGVNAKSESHIALAKLYILAKDNKIQIKDSENISSIIQAAVHLKQAADLEPDNAELRFQLARLVYHSGLDYKTFPVDVLKYLTQAVNLQPNNISYIFALKSWIELFEQFRRGEKIYQDACKAYDALGGAPSQHSDVYWTLSNPYQL